MILKGKQRLNAMIFIHWNECVSTGIDTSFSKWLKLNKDMIVTKD